MWRRRAESQKPIQVVTLEAGHQPEKEIQNMEADVTGLADINLAGSTDVKKKGE